MGIGTKLWGIAALTSLCLGTLGCSTFERSEQVPRYIQGQIPEALQLNDTTSLVSFPRTEVVETLEDQIGPGVGRFLASVPERGKIDSVPGERDHDTMEVPSYFDLLSTVQVHAN